MISKVTMMSKAYGGLSYVMGKKRAEILFSNHARTDSILHASQDFESIRQMRHKVRNTTLHISVSYAYEDSIKLNNENMEKMAKGLLKKLELEDHQVVCVRHHDAKHDHFHLIINKISLTDFKVYPDSFIKNRAARACDELEVEFELSVARGHGQAIKHKWSEKNVVKEEIKKAINEGLSKGVQSFKELQAYLEPHGIELKIQYHKNGQVNGLSFRKGEIALKGSAIDKRFSYKRINKRLSQKTSTKIPGKQIAFAANKISRELQQMYSDNQDDGVLHIEKIFQLNKSKSYER